VSSIRDPKTAKEVLFAKKQEASRKDVERCFGVLKQRFQILVHPCKLWYPEALDIVAKAYAILHNMIIDDVGDAPATINYLYEDHLVTASSPAQEHDYLHTLKAIKDTDDGKQLKRDLMEHVWNYFKNRA